MCVAEREENQKLSEISFSAEGARNPLSLPSAHSTPGRVYCQLFFSAACSSCETSEKLPLAPSISAPPTRAKKSRFWGDMEPNGSRRSKSKGRSLCSPKKERKKENAASRELARGAFFFPLRGRKNSIPPPLPLSLSLSFCRLLTCRIVMLILRRRGMTTVVEGSG